MRLKFVSLILLMMIPAAAGAADVASTLKALQDLGQKVHQVSKNQQALESRLDSLRKRLDAVHSNTIVGAEWLRTWSYCVLMNLDDPPTPFVPSGVTEPHWK